MTTFWILERDLGVRERERERADTGFYASISNLAN